MSKFLLIDFGASRIKAAIFCLETLLLSVIESYPAPGNCSNKGPGYYEISCEDIRASFQRICIKYREKQKIDGIFLCSQMHGFAMMNSSGGFESNYISWQDQRSIERIDGIETFSLIQEQISPYYFKKITGSRLRSLYPFVKLVHILRESRSASTYSVVDLCGVITGGSGVPNRIHASMLAGMGVMNLSNGSTEQMDQLIDSITGQHINWGILSDETCVAGYWVHDGERTPIHVGVGDHQCSVLGAGNRPNQTISLNLGTGSQVSIIRDHYEEIVHDDIDIRPYFGHQYMQCVTHIPSGRVLRAYVELIESTVLAGKGNLDVWKQLASIQIEESHSCLPSFNMALFDGAWGFDGIGGRVCGIHENNWNLNSYLAGLITSYTQQYQQVVSLLDPEERISQCIVSGGVPRKIPIIKDIFRHLLNREICMSDFYEETLVGLAVIALKTFDGDKTWDNCGSIIQSSITANHSAEEEDCEPGYF